MSNKLKEYINSLNSSKLDLKYFLSGTFYTGLSSIVGLLVPIIIIPHLIKSVGLENYGISAVAFTISYFFAMIVDFGFNITGVNKLAKEKSDKLKTLVIVNIIYTKGCIFLILAPVFFLIYNYSISNILELNVYFISLTIPFASILNLSWALQGLHKIKMWSLLTMLGQVFYIILVYSFIDNHEDVILINFFYGLGLLISGIASLAYIIKKYALTFHKVDFNAILDELRGGYHFFISNVGNYLSLYFLGPLIGYLISYEMAGIYSIIEKIYNIARRPFTIYQTFMLPRISQLVSKSNLKAINYIRGTYIFVILFIILEIIVIYTFRQQIITYFTPDNFELLEKMLSYALLGLVIVTVNCPLSLYLVASDKKQVFMRMSISSPVFGLLTGVLLIHQFGVLGSIVTLILVEVFYVIYLLYANKLK